MKKVSSQFFNRDVLEVAADLIGKVLVRRFPDGSCFRSAITEVEAYRGSEDRACHAYKRRTARTEVMYGEAGLIYVYLIYGMYWLLNIVTGDIGEPSAVLIRGTIDVSGPGRIGKALQLDKSWKGKNIAHFESLWIEEGTDQFSIVTKPRVGVEYAGEEWATKPWRWVGTLINK